MPYTRRLVKISHLVELRFDRRKFCAAPLGTLCPEAFSILTSESRLKIVLATSFAFPPGCVSLQGERRATTGPTSKRLSLFYRSERNDILLYKKKISLGKEMSPPPPPSSAFSPLIFTYSPICPLVCGRCLKIADLILVEPSLKIRQIILNMHSFRPPSAYITTV